MCALGELQIAPIFIGQADHTGFRLRWPDPNQRDRRCAPAPMPWAWPLLNALSKPPARDPYRCRVHHGGGVGIVSLLAALTVVVPRVSTVQPRCASAPHRSSCCIERVGGRAAIPHAHADAGYEGADRVCARVCNLPAFLPSASAHYACRRDQSSSGRNARLVTCEAAAP